MPPRVFGQILDPNNSNGTNARRSVSPRHTTEPSDIASSEEDGATQLQRTFGIELEVVVAYHIGYLDDFESDVRTRAEGAVWHALDSKGIAVHTPEYFDDNPDDFTKWGIETEFCWGLNKLEARACPRPISEWAITCIEIISPVFSYDTDDWQTEISKVLSILRTGFNQKEVFLFCNESTGLHIHVGNREDGFPFHTVRNFVQLVTAYEKCIDLLHSDDRIDNGNGNTYNHPPSFFFNDGHSNMNDWLSRILQCQTIRELADLFRVPECKGKRRIYNLDNLLSSDLIIKCEDIDQFKFTFTGMNTIEFRQHRATLDFAEVEAWINTAARMIYVAHNISEEELLMHVSETVKHADYRHMEFLYDLGVDQNTRDYYEKRLKIEPSRSKEIDAAVEEARTRLGRPYGLAYIVHHKYGRYQFLAEITAAETDRTFCARDIVRKVWIKQLKGIYGLSWRATRRNCGRPDAHKGEPKKKPRFQSKQEREEERVKDADRCSWSAMDPFRPRYVPVGLLG